MIATTLPFDLFLCLSAAAGAAGFFRLQTGRDVKSRTHGSIHVIDLDGLNFFKQVFVDHEGNSLFRKEAILVPRFIQNQAQRRP